MEWTAIVRVGDYEFIVTECGILIHWQDWHAFDKEWLAALVTLTDSLSEVEKAVLADGPIYARRSDGSIEVSPHYLELPLKP